MNDKSPFVSREDYDLCERENSNLRLMLRWAAERLSADDLVELRKIMDEPIEEGGLTSEVDLYSEEERVRRTLLDLADHVECLNTSTCDIRVAGEKRPAMWYARLDHLLNTASEFDKHQPKATRFGGQPNVFRMIHKKNLDLTQEQARHLLDMKLEMTGDDIPVDPGDVVKVDASLRPV